jgi:exodeoxyribonuclease-5
MTPLEIFLNLRANLPFEPTKGQEGVLYSLSEFLYIDEQHPIYRLSGYAGTGKTSMIRAITATLKLMGRKYALLAPTGRAAKVISAYSGERSFTIHRMIYQTMADEDGRLHFVLRKNTGKDAVVIVDEASMIGGESAIGGTDLLSDLMEFVASGKRCRLILIGDTAQLPPVGSNLSPALDPEVLAARFQFERSMQAELTEVVRQQRDSGILQNATYLRSLIRGEEDDIRLMIDKDVIAIDGSELAELLADEVARHGREGVMLITRSNKRANRFNAQIRLQVLGFEDEFVPNDMLMVVKNNYHWLDAKTNKNELIANGDMVEVVRIGRTHHYHGFRFTDLTIRMYDTVEANDVDVRVWTDCLMAEGPAMPADDVRVLHGLVRAEASGAGSQKEMRKLMEADPYLNALQVKYGYAVTCHKAQGGQWPVVFIDQGYLTEEMLDANYLRWLYTAFTRATEKVYLINFNARFFE